MWWRELMMVVGLAVTGAVIVLGGMAIAAAINVWRDWRYWQKRRKGR